MSATAEAPAWARGYDLAWLKEVAAVFRADFKPHTYGAFGIPKERDVADAHYAGDLLTARRSDDEDGPRPIVAAAIVRRVGQARTAHEDFAGRKAYMFRGDYFVSRLAGTMLDKTRLMRHLVERATSEARAVGRTTGYVWVEAHVENPETCELLSALGFERVMTKVAASSDLKGLWLFGGMAGRGPAPLHPADEASLSILHRSFLPQAGVERRAIAAELKAYLAAGGGFAQHYSSYNKGKSWTAFALRGYDPDAPGFIIKPAEMSKAWKEENPSLLEAKCMDTVAAEDFPRTLEILHRLIPRRGFEPFQRVRFMRLSAAGGELTRHADITDPEAGTEPGQVARLHIPLVTDPACVFRSWRLDGQEVRQHMPVGSLCYLDTRKPHAVVNPARSERVHLVVDTFVTEPLRDRIAER